MTQEKELLLKDLSTRLMYGVMCQVDDGAAGLNDGKLVEIDISKELVRFDADGYWDAYIDDVKPYLRSMSSMTEEEKHELLKFGVVNLDKDNNAIDVCCVGFENHAKVQDYLNSIHVDYRGLIKKVLLLK